MYTAKDVKDLRDKTGAGMLDCKKALEASSGNMDVAIDWLRENGMAKAAKKESRIAADGFTEARADENVAALVEVNCETDFVAKNEEFREIVAKIVKAIINNEVNTMDEANALVLEDDITIADTIVNFTAKIGEKISFRRFERIVKTDEQTFGIYSHMGGKITVVVVLNGNDRDVAKDVAMHACAMNPSYVKISEVPTEVISHEEDVIKEQLLNEGKPADRVEGIVNGKINKFYSDIVLEEQLFIKSENKETVKQFASQNNSEVVSMIRYAVGEGIEKREENFAEEVMSQIKGN